ncbi:MAG: protocatechuate 3,4-dioxygenase [Deltaproteobacteria bacterium]|nr:protocatechuate 3,4-dioxygenase [Deltaproteobacteria bacterium]
MNRRRFLKAGLIIGASGLLVNRAFSKNRQKFSPTPPETEGPFYPLLAQKDKDFDLTRIKGKEGVAKGKIIFVEGRVLDREGNPLEDATVDLWQANAAGKYNHPHDKNPAPIDPDFQGWAIVPSGKEGTFRFKTIMPGLYPAAPNWLRPPHIHFKVSKKGYIELITQMYFPDHELNHSDLLLKRKSKEERKLMISSKVKDKPEVYDYNMVLEKVR